MIQYVSLYTLLFVFVQYYPSEGQIKDIITSHGPSSSVRTILQDRAGNMWLASNEGIFRYDGQSFTNLTANVTSDRFFSMIEDRNGHFWFGTYGSGVYYYDGKSFQHVTSQQGLANNQVSTIYEDKTGAVWFGSNGAVSRYDGKSFRHFTTEGGHPTNDVNTILEDRQGNIWFGTRGYTYVYDGNTFAVFTYKDNSFGNIWSIIEDRDGTIWLGGSSGLWRYDGRTSTQVIQKPIFRVYKDKKGNFWISSASTNGMFTLSRYAEKSLSGKNPMGTEIAQSLNLFGIMEARDGSVWFGANDGVYRYYGTTLTNVKR